MQKKLSLGLISLLIVLFLINLSLAQPTKSQVEVIEVDNQVVVGETDKYEALCRRCFQKEN